MAVQEASPGAGRRIADPLWITHLLVAEDVLVADPEWELAHALDLIVVAEGVESIEDWRTLTRLGCDQAQGVHDPVVADAP